MARPRIPRKLLTLPACASGSAAGDPPCLVHLVRVGNDPGLLRDFADALRRHPPGVDFELILAFKGFASSRQTDLYVEELADLEPKAVHLSDEGFDLTAYFAVAARLRRHRYCFVKSQCRPLADGWLAKLDAALAAPGVGQAGATGAWTSRRSWIVYSLGLPGAYRHLLPPAPVGRAYAAMHEEPEPGARISPPRTVLRRLRALPRAPRELLDFGPFPTPHLRTTAFMISHAALAELRLPRVATKLDALALESGRASITNQLQRNGMSSLVVDRAGATYGPADWHLSRTFMQGDQEGLLVAENHTDFYQHSDLDRRRYLSSCVWGASADPAPPRAALSGRAPSARAWRTPRDAATGSR
jgi:hypothetical protein